MEDLIEDRLGAFFHTLHKNSRFAFTETALHSTNLFKRLLW